jgi:hypothetical protein
MDKTTERQESSKDTVEEIAGRLFEKKTSPPFGSK